MRDRPCTITIDGAPLVFSRVEITLGPPMHLAVFTVAGATPDGTVTLPDLPGPCEYDVPPPFQEAK